MHSTYAFFVIFLVLEFFQTTSAQTPLTQIPVFDIHLENLLKMQQGLGWPHRLEVAEGHEALLKLDSSLPYPQSCTVTTPSGLTFEVSSPPSNRYQSWGEECGLRIRNVEEADEGRWRLTAVRDNSSIVGWTEVIIEKDTSNYAPPVISLQDGKTDVDVVLTTLDNSYCVVAQPFSESSLVPGNCHVTLEKTTRAVQGNWNVLLGIPGRVQELQLDRQVTVEAERLDVGYVHDSNTNKLHLYCNILHTEKNITFCRFQQTSRAFGYNVMDGLSDGTHSYYGEGFLKRQCGMTIETPTTQDYGTWRCSVGVQRWVGDHIEQETPLQALISVASYNDGRKIIRKLRDEEHVPETIFVEENEMFTIMCRASVSLTYCWFQHPNGTQYTPVAIVDENQPFWYTGESLQTGECGITFSHATKEEEGQWTCHLGPREQIGIEVTERINVRVTGSLAANQKTIGVAVGANTTLHCHTSNGNKPLDYCRFLSPKLIGLSIDSSVTENSAILDRYYFTPGRHLDYGDCSLTISSVQNDDLGEWTCAALLHQNSEESRDTIIVYLEASVTTPRSQAGIVGMAVGLSVLVVTLAGYVFYKKVWLSRRLNNSNQIAMSDLINDFSNTSRASSNTSGSIDSTILDRTIQSNAI